MRKTIQDFVALAVEHLPLAGPIYEFGSLQVQDDPALEDLRPLFPGLDYVGCDMRAGPGVDKVLDLHAIDLPDSSVGTVVTMDTFEHVEFPRQAISEIHRILKPDGHVIMSSVMDFPIHGYPNDYWRFTPEGFRSLLQDFTRSYVGSYGAREDFPQVIVGVGFMGPAGPNDGFETAAGNWAHRASTICRKLEAAERMGEANWAG